jgi:competence ComEA-like helix-hairpin-helix protein
MRRLKALIMVTFGFSRSEARAFIILLPLVFVIISVEPVYQAWFLSGNPDHFEDPKMLDSLVATWKWNVKSDTKTVRPPTLFRFNPNKVTIEEMDSLGIPVKVSQRIANYRSKGGSFKIRSDLSKIYGLDSSLFATLEPFIDLPLSSAKRESSKPVQLARKSPVPTTKAIIRFDLNTADTTQLNSVYGIGPALARRIVVYRNRLGGFVHPDQLYEVWGLDSATVERTLTTSEITPAFRPRMININTISERELASHPYMKPKTARLIVAYRFQHGNFASIEDLEKIKLLDTKTFERIRAYLTLE